MHRSIIATWGVVALVAVGSIAAAQSPAPKPRPTPRPTATPIAFTARGHAEISVSLGDRDVSGTAELGMSQRANLTRFDVISVHSDAVPLPPLSLTVVIDRTARTAAVWSTVTKHFYVQRFTVSPGPGPGPTPTPSPFPLFVGRSPFANLDVLDFRVRLTGHGTTASIATTGLEFEAHFASKGSTKVAHVTATTQLADEYGGFPMAIDLAFESTGSTQTAKMSYGVDSLTRDLPDIAGFRVPAGYTRSSSVLAVILNGFSTGNGGTSFPVFGPTHLPAAASPTPAPAPSPSP